MLVLSKSSQKYLTNPSVFSDDSRLPIQKVQPFLRKLVHY